MINTVWSKYRVEFCCSDGRKGSYIGDTVEELHEAINNDRGLDKDKGMRDILKHGYFWEFKNRPYITKDYVIDNGIHFMWTAR